MNDIDRFLFNIACGNEVSSKVINEKFFEKVVENRIIDSVLKWDKELTINGDSWESRKNKSDVKLRELKKIIQMVRKENIPFLNLKGLAMYKYYLSKVPRQSNDFDFLIKDIDSYWNFHNILIKNDYNYLYNPMFTTFDGVTVGITKYYKEIDKNTTIYIEVNIGKFIIAEVSWFGNIDLWNTYQVYNYKGIDLNIPSDNYNLIILVIESSDRKTFYIRDIVDFYYIVKSGNIDWDFINSTLNDSYLRLVLKKLWANYKCLNNDVSITGKKVRTVRREFLHILPFLMKEKNRCRKTFYRYLKLLGEKFVYKDKFLSVFHKVDKLMKPKDRFYNGIVTHFIPMSSKLTGKFEWIRYKNLDFLITPIGVFLASNFAILSEEDEFNIKDFLSIIEREEKKVE